MLGMLMWYSPSSLRSSSVTCDAPSMIVAAELPKNLDLGRISPQISRLFSGDVKYLREKLMSARRGKSGG
jgi:hypothetical protein